VLLGVLLWPRPEALYRVTVLPSLGGKLMAATGINERGQVTGFAQMADGVFHFFLWDRESGLQDLGPAVQGNFYINDAGQIAGTTQDAAGNSLAFRWDRAQGMRILGTLGGPESMPTALNNHGQVVGWSGTPAGPSHAFIWDPTTGMRDLGTFGGAKSQALGINDAGQVLGSADSATEEFQPFLWDADGGMRAVNAPAASRAAWFSINNHGYALGHNDTHMFLWRSDLGVRNPFPRPGSYILPVVNDVNQVLFGEARHPKIVPVWARRFVQPVFRCYLWDPERGKIPLDPRVRPKLGEILCAWDLNNQGCIVGVLGNNYTKRGRAVLLEPIPERWRESDGAREDAESRSK